MGKVLKNLAIYLLVVLLVVFLIKITTPPQQEVKDMVASDFYSSVEKGLIKDAKLVVDNNMVKVTGELKTGVAYRTEVIRDTGLERLLDEHNIKFTSAAAAGPPWWSNILGTLLPILLLMGLLFFMLQQTQGGGSRVMQFGKSKAKLHADEKHKVTFRDVAGADEVKEELEEVVEFLKSPKKFSELGAKIPKGVLLSGSPGTGKTLLARAVAGEAGVPFFSISGSDFVEMFVGVGASRVRDLFEQAKKNSPCIVFIDEIDAVGRQRGAGLGGGHDEREQTLNQLLVEMDGFSANEGIIIIAATNRPDILDPALLRPGRFDRQIVVSSPDVKGREEILKVHIKGKPLAELVDLKVIARRTPGFTGADLANLLNESALLAARRGLKKIGMPEIEDSIERVIAGPEKKSRVINEKEKRLVAFHEAGHAIVAHYLPKTDPVHKVSIIPRGNAGGYTLVLPKEDRSFMTKNQILDQIVMLLGGRVAEELFLSDISTGAHNDIERASELVRRIITEYGMSEELGPLNYSRNREQVFLGRDISRDYTYSEAVAVTIDKEARRFMDDCYAKAKKILTDYSDKLELVAKTLMERETLEADEFLALMEGRELEELKKEAKPEDEVKRDKEVKLVDANAKEISPVDEAKGNSSDTDPIIRFSYRHNIKYI